MNQHQAILQQHLAAENAHDMEATLATLHPQCQFEEVPLARTYHGLEGARQHYNFWWSTFDLHFERTLAQHWTQDNKFIAEAEFSGTHIGKFMGIEATQREVHYPFVVVVEFRDGLLATERFYFDATTIWQQIS